MLHYVTWNKKMHTFQINALIGTFTSSTCFEPHGFIIRKKICMHSFCTIYFTCIYVSRLAGGRLCLWFMVHNFFTMQGAKNVKYDVISLPFFNQDLVIENNYSMFSLLSAGTCWGRSCIRVSKQTCNYWEIRIHLCVSIARKRNNMKYANCQRSLIVCKYKNTKKNF